MIGLRSLWQSHCSTASLLAANTNPRMVAAWRGFSFAFFYYFFGFSFRRSLLARQGMMI
jgi:hypothetical protein